MTKDEIIEMARQAKAIPIHKDFNQLALIGTENIEAFAELVAEKEFKKGFYAGWEESGEGFNSEYECLKSRVIEMCETAWEENKKI